MGRHLWSDDEEEDMRFFVKSFSVIMLLGLAAWAAVITVTVKTLQWLL